MADYLDVAEAIDRPGMRLALTQGVPGPWSESAKSIFHVKGIEYTKVRQLGGMENPALLRWTGRENAPVAVYGDEPARDGWAEILYLAERIAPEPKLVPDDFVDRVLMFGLAREICGEGGFGWMRRLMMIDVMLGTDAPPAARAPAELLGARYGYSKPAAAAAKDRVIEILERFSARLIAQRDAGSRYFVGDALSALDIYWACFAALYDPMTPDRCPMPDYLRGAYTCADPDVRKAADPILLEHRDFVYETQLQLPMDF